MKKLDELLIGMKPVFDMGYNWQWEFPVSGIQNVTYEFEADFLSVDWGTGDGIIGIAMGSCEGGGNAPIRIVL